MKLPSGFHTLTYSTSAIVVVVVSAVAVCR